MVGIGSICDRFLEFALTGFELDKMGIESYHTVVT